MDLASIRAGMKLTQAEFAERLGVAPAYVGHLETGHRRPSISLAFKIEQISGVDGYADQIIAAKVKSEHRKARAA